VSEVGLTDAKERLVGAGLEIYRAREETVEIAERVRLHLMDSGIRVRVGSAIGVRFTARLEGKQPSPEAALSHVREAIGQTAIARGYAEVESRVVDVKDPVDDTRVLDVWHEVVYGKSLQDLDQAIEEVRWALGVERTLSP
jgi:hypothetical protein